MKVQRRKSGAAFIISTALFMVFLAASCTTTPYAQREDNVQKVIDLINEGEAEALMAQSRLPFLFDGEILMLERDVRNMWENLAGADFSMKNAEHEYIGPAGRYSYPPFADSMEVRTFFKKYLPEKSSIVRITADNGEFFLLLGPRDETAPTIIGYRMNL